MTVNNIAKVGFNSNNDNYENFRPDYPKEVISEIKNHISDNKINNKVNVLELGSGTGKFSKLLLNEFDENELGQLYAVEPSDGMRDGFTKNINDNRAICLKGDFENIPVDNATVDIAIIAQAYHWCKDYDNSLREIRKKMKNHSGFIVLVWNLEDRSEKEWMGVARDYYESFEQNSPQYRLGKWKSLFTEHYYKDTFEDPIYKKYTRNLPSTVDAFVSRIFTKSYINILDDEKKNEIKNTLSDIILNGKDVEWIDDNNKILNIPYSTDLFIIKVKK